MRSQFSLLLLNNKRTDQNMLRSPLTLRCFFGVTAAKPYSVAAELHAAKPFSEVPKIPGLPVIGAGWAYLPFIGKYKLTEMHHASTSKYKEYGPLVREKINVNFDMLHVFEVEDIEKVLRNEGRTPHRIALKLMKQYRDERKDRFKNAGIFLTNGEEWYQVRSEVQPHMMKPKAVHNYIESMDQVAKQMVENTIMMRKGNGGEVQDYLSELYKWALESVGLVALDAHLGCLDKNPNQESSKMISLVQEVFLQALLLEFGPLPLWKFFDTPMKKKFYNNMDEFSEVVVKYLNAAKKRLQSLPEDHETTFLDNLLSTTKDPAHITTMIIDMFFAGTDTSATTVALTLYHLARNRKAQDRAHQEVRKVLQEKGMCVEALNEVKFLKACVKESMRLTPVAIGSARSLPEDIVLRGYHVPAGTFIVLNNYVTGREEKYFSNAKEFRPERFLREESQHHPFAFLPFGFGPRSCVGRRIAEQEIWILLMRILERFRVEYRHEEIGLKTRLLSTPDRPLHFQFYDK